MPKIYCFINGAWGPDDVGVMALAEDGTTVGGHVSSNEDFAKHDIGINSEDHPKHAAYRQHYPDGYELEWVERSEVTEHEGLQAALKLALPTDEDDA